MQAHDVSQSTLNAVKNKIWQQLFVPIFSVTVASISVRMATAFASRVEQDPHTKLPIWQKLVVSLRLPERKQLYEVAFIMAFTVAISEGGTYFANATSNFLKNKYAQVVLAAIVLGAGFAAFWFKKKNQRAYGACEIFFGVASAFRLAQNLRIQQAMIAQWAALVGAVYVVSRGLNNVYDAQQKRISSR